MPWDLVSGRYIPEKTNIWRDCVDGYIGAARGRGRGLARRGGGWPARVCCARARARAVADARRPPPAATRASPYSLASGSSAPCAMPSAVLSTVDADWVKVRACADTEGAPHGVRVRLPRGRGRGLFACPLFGRSDCDGFFTRALRRGGGGVEGARERGRAPQRVAPIGALSGRIVLSVWLTCHCLHRRCPTHCAASLVPINAVVVRLNLIFCTRACANPAGTCRRGRPSERGGLLRRPPPGARSRQWASRSGEVPH